MAEKPNARFARKMKPVILVFCEGETEAAYIDLLRQIYRLPIKIISKIIGQEIENGLIEKYKKDVRIVRSENIDSYFMYDAEVPEIIERIRGCRGTALLSNPCIEVWFLLHLQKLNKRELSSSECIQLLTGKDGWKHYEKGRLSITQREVLGKNCPIAVQNAKSLGDAKNPFSTVYRFIEMLDLKKNT